MTENTQYGRVVRFHETGNPSVLKIANEAVVEPNLGEVRIKVKALGLNRAEVMFRTASYLEQPELPARLGYEAAGYIDALGTDVDEFKLGDRVSTIPAFSMNEYGVYGDYAIVPVGAVAKIPGHFNFSQGAALWMQYITAYGALVEIGRLKAKQNVLITAASSSVGVALTQLAKALGAKVFAASRGTDKKQFLLGLGADHVVNSQSNEFVETVMTLTNGEGIHLTIDPIGGPIIEQLAELSAQNATIIEYGALSTEQSPFPLFSALAKGLSIRGYTLFEITKDSEKLSMAKDFLLELFEKSSLAPLLDKSFELEDIADAHKYMESNQQKGKIIVNL